MKFGIFYEHQLPRPWNDGDELKLFQDALRQVELADKLGIDYAWEVEHHFLEEYSHSSAPEIFLAAASQRTTQIRLLPEPLLLVLGTALVDRGELESAARALAGATSSSALVLLGDLAERRGDIPIALSLIERVLLRDLDHPGARERHRRWRSQLGYEIEHKAVAPGATVVTREPDAPFVTMQYVNSTPALAHLATVPAMPNSASSGWA